MIHSVSINSKPSGKPPLNKQSQFQKNEEKQVNVAMITLSETCSPNNYFLSLVQLLNPVWLCDPWTPAFQASLSIINSQSLLKLMPIESVMPSNHLILSCPFLLLHSILPSNRVFSNESVLCIRWPKYCTSASASVLPVNIQDWFC